MLHEQKNNGAKSASKESRKESPDQQRNNEGAHLVTDERAQYEVFRNGELPRETLAKWLRNDLQSVSSLVNGCLQEPTVFEALVDAYYKKYQALHTKKTEDVEEGSN